MVFAPSQVVSRISNEPSTVSWGLSSIWKVYSPSYPIDFRPFTRVTSKTHLPEEYECNSLKGIPLYPNQQLKIRWLSRLFRIRYRKILWCLIGGGWYEPKVWERVGSVKLGGHVGFVLLLETCFFNGKNPTKRWWWIGVAEKWRNSSNVL